MNIKKSYDYIVVGSGFGGAFAAYKFAKANKSVLILDRGISVKRDDSCWDEDKLHLGNPPLYHGQTPFYVNQKKGKVSAEWPDDTVGGMSTMYGCASFRLREADFLGAPMENSAERDPSTSWPFTYKELAPYYEEAEKLLGIAGNKGEDITEPPRNKYPQPSFEKLSPPSKRIWKASEKLGLNPFRLPMAMNLDGKHGKEKCILCDTCDHYLCKIEAKNDVAVTVLPEAVAAGATLLEDTRALNINVTNGRAVSIDMVNQTSGEQYTVKAKKIIVAGGALNSPHLLLSSGIDEMIDNGHLIGRNLMRHINGVMAGVFPYRTNKIKMFQKMVGIPDFYEGDPSNPKALPGPWGMIQEVSSIGKGVIKQNAPFGLKNVAAAMASRLTNLLVIAEDIPQYDNRVFVDKNQRDKFGMPSLNVFHRYSQRDLQVRKSLYKKAMKILFKAGAMMFYPMPIETFSHALGTCKMGDDPATSVVNPRGQVWGVKNLYVTDASIMPTGGSVNPSLTIAALSLKIADEMK